MVEPRSPPDLALLVEANQRLVLAALRAQEQSVPAVAPGWAVGRPLDPLARQENRNLVLERIASAIAGCRRGGARFALLSVALNNFTEINESLGHAHGDQVLAMARQRLLAGVGAHDGVLPYGDDQFVLLLAEVVHAADAAAAAERVIACLGHPHRLGEHVVRLAASIGVSMYPRDGDGAATLLDLADLARHDARRCTLGGALVAPALDALQRPVIAYQLAQAEHERRHGQLREINEQLLLAAIDAQALKEAADAAHRQLTDFLAMLAHELRNPLGPIRTAAALMSGVPAAELPALQAVIQRQVKHIARLIGDLLDVSRVSTGKLRLELEDVDLTSVIDDAVQACRPAMDTRLQTFSVKLPASPVRMRGDSVRLTQVLSNLLDNASKYTPRGGQVRLSVAAGDGRLAVTVTDTGIGIPAATLPRIFDPFVQDSHAVAFSGAGLGIGLTVVRELVEGHGGTVTVHSAGAGQGSQFVVSLPLRAD
jgi:diguanylate cyclase (GGDEF)-like protein